MCKMIFGITGTTGTGKSTASGIFRRLGVDVIDADATAHEVTASGEPCLDEIVRCFGKDILFEDGSLNRRHLGKIVFSDKQKLAALTDITHKYIKERILEKIEKSQSRICAVDGAVLIGSNMESMCSFMVVITASEETRKKRIIARDTISEADAQNRIKSQKDDAFYRSHGDYVIENNGSEEELEREITEIYKRILNERILN